jgi:hypothetical protein
MNILVAGQDMMAVDNVCVDIMGFDIREIKHLEPVDGIRILGETIEAVRSPFKRPMAFFERDHFVVHMDEKACTMCTVSLYQALSKILNTPELKQALMSRSDLAEVNVILGPMDPPSNLGTCALCLGDCSTKTAKTAGLRHIRGCHPDYREVVNFFFPGTYEDAEAQE